MRRAGSWRDQLLTQRRFGRSPPQPVCARQCLLLVGPSHPRVAACVKSTRRDYASNALTRAPHASAMMGAPGTKRGTTMNRAFVRAVVLTVILTSAATTAAQVRIGGTLSTTGPAASLGIPEKNTLALLPQSIGGKSVQYIVLDDATDT